MSSVLVLAVNEKSNNTIFYLRICYPHNHPALAYHLMNIGVLANKCGQLQLAERHLDEALQMVGEEYLSLGCVHTSLTEKTLRSLFTLSLFIYHFE